MTDDLRLQREVIEALAHAIGTDAALVGVSVAAGVATLHGTFRDDRKRVTTQRTAEEIVGIRAVIDASQIRSAEQAAIDAELARRALAALRAEPGVPWPAIKIRVEDGWLTMDGEVETEEVRQQARRTLRHLFGLRGLSNMVVVRTAASGQAPAGASGL